LAPGGKLETEQKMAFKDPTFRAAISTKPTAWSYEEEWRYVEEASGSFLWPGPITEVIFGSNMLPGRRAHYTALVSNTVANPVAFYEVATSADYASFVLKPLASHQS
jgi:hypothetical protein